MQPLTVGDECHGFLGTFKGNRILTLRVTDAAGPDWVTVECIGSNLRPSVERRYYGRKWVVRRDSMRATLGGTWAILFTPADQ